MSLYDDTDIVRKKLEKYPFSRLAFITIRDPTQQSKWCEISKIRTWCRRYSTDYIIVRGIKGGIHFHILIGLRVGCNPKCQKGIHFHIKLLNDDCKSEILFDSPEDVQDRLKREYYRHEKFEELTMDEDINCQCIISQINAMVKKYWKVKSAVIKKAKVLDRKQTKIKHVIDYLQLNLDENEDIDKYITHWF